MVDPRIVPRVGRIGAKGCQGTDRRIRPRRRAENTSGSRSPRRIRFPGSRCHRGKAFFGGLLSLALWCFTEGFLQRFDGHGRFKSMEETGTISNKVRCFVLDFCSAMAKPLSELVRQIPKITERDLHELPLLTFGSQLQGSNNTQIGKTAMKEVFVAIKEIVEAFIVEATDKRLNA